MEIRIKKEYEALLPPLPPNEYEALKQSIRENGLFVPIIVNREGEILDGHNRFNICTELGIEPRHETMEFEDPLLEKRFVIESNLQRRHLTPFARIEMALPLLEIERKLAKQRMLAGHPRPNLGEGGKATEIVATRIGVSHGLFEMALTVIEEADEGDKKKLRTHLSAISAVYNKIMRGRQREQTPEIPEGEFNIILADPPWKYEFSRSKSRAIETKYPTMELEDICSLEIPAADDSILFLWTPAPKLREGLRVLEAWGFEYKTNLVWVKDKIGMGYYARSQHELVLIGTKGEMPPPEIERRPHSVITAPRGEHSRKPDELYEIIERMYPNGQYLELFARRTRSNWTSWGSEIA